MRFFALNVGVVKIYIEIVSGAYVAKKIILDDILYQCEISILLLYIKNTENFNIRLPLKETY